MGAESGNEAVTAAGTSQGGLVGRCMVEQATKAFGTDDKADGRGKLPSNPVSALPASVARKFGGCWGSGQIELCEGPSSGVGGDKELSSESWTEKTSDNGVRTAVEKC